MRRTLILSLGDLILAGGLATLALHPRFEAAAPPLPPLPHLRGRVNAAVCGPADESIAKLDYPGASRWLTAAASTDSVCATRQEYQRARCELETGQAATAGRRLVRLQGADPRLEDYRRLWLARAMAQTGEVAAADRLADSLAMVATSPAVRLEAAMLRAEWLTADGRHRQAVAAYQTLRRQRPTDATVLRQLAIAQRAAGDRTGAAASWLQLARQHAAKPEALEAIQQLPAGSSPAVDSVRAAVFTAHRQFPAAATEYRRLLRRWPRDARAGEWWCGLGAACLAAGQLDQASAALSQAYPARGYAPALFYQGRLAVRRDRDQAALDAYLEMSSKAPKHPLTPEALWQAGRTAERLGQYEIAARAYQRLHRDYPDHEHAGEAAWCIGFAAYCRGAFGEAEAAFAGAAADGGPGYLVDQNLYWEGKAAERCGDATRAAERYRQAAQGFPRSYYAARAVARGYPAPAVTGRATADDDRAAAGAGFQAALAAAAALRELGDVAAAQRETRLLEESAGPDTGRLRLLRDQYERFGWYDLALKVAGRVWNSVEARPADLSPAYPDYYWREASEAAAEAGIDAFLVLAVVRQESSFAPDARSSAGAVGLMQLLPETGAAVARQVGMPGFEASQLTEPGPALRLGARYLQQQLQAFGGSQGRLSMQLALSAYNAGPHNARRWADQLPLDDDDVFVEKIPFAETRSYVKLVLRNYSIYRALADV